MAKAPIKIDSELKKRLHIYAIEEESSLGEVTERLLTKALDIELSRKNKLRKSA